MSKADELEQARNDRLIAAEHEGCEAERVIRDELLAEIDGFVYAARCSIDTAMKSLDIANAKLEKLQQ